MHVLIVGSGGREHALAWKATQSPLVNKVYIAPGNGGTALEPEIENIDIDVLDIAALINFCKKYEVDLTIVGPEAPLAAGIVDRFQEHDLACFGPSEDAAQLESSKAYSKAFMEMHNIPTGRYATFADKNKAIAYLKKQDFPIVIKADGLAAGKGVVIAQTLEQAITTVEDMLEANRYGDAGSVVVIEEFLVGEEASFMVLSDGESSLSFASSQDHKARDDGDKGPNTGGMGAYSPAPVVSPEIEQKILETVIKPTIAGMASEGNIYKGFLYAGVMVSPNGDINVLEFNCRLGDPETQPLMMRLDSDLVELCLAAVNGQLADKEIHWRKEKALGVVLCAGGYPQSYRKGDVIDGLDLELDQNSKIFHAGTKDYQGNIVTNGGRVLCITVLSDSIRQAQQQAYTIAQKVRWPDCFMRHDIGHRAISREDELIT